MSVSVTEQVHVHFSAALEEAVAKYGDLQGGEAVAVVLRASTSKGPFSAKSTKTIRVV